MGKTIVWQQMQMALLADFFGGGLRERNGSEDLSGSQVSFSIILHLSFKAFSFSSALTCASTIEVSKFLLPFLYICDTTGVKNELWSVFSPLWVLFLSLLLSLFVLLSFSFFLSSLDCCFWMGAAALALQYRTWERGKDPVVSEEYSTALEWRGTS